MIQLPIFLKLILDIPQKKQAPIDVIIENVTEFKAENCIYIEDAENAMNKDTVEAPEAVPNSDPEADDV